VSGFWCWKFKQIVKVGFGRKSQLSPQCVHTWGNNTSYTNISTYVLFLFTSDLLQKYVYFTAYLTFFWQDFSLVVLLKFPRPIFKNPIPTQPPKILKPPWNFVVYLVWRHVTACDFAYMKARHFKKWNACFCLNFCFCFFFLETCAFLFYVFSSMIPTKYHREKNKTKKKGKKPHIACFHGSFVFFQTPAFIFYVSSSIILTK
jgi:hypothetical protein